MTDEKKIILVIGKRGSGKSYLVKKLIQSRTRLLIWDLMSEYTGCVVFTAEEWETFRAFFLKVYYKKFRIAYRPLHPKEEIDRIARLIYELGNVTFVVEEIDAICGSNYIDPTLECILHRGRHRNIELIGVTPAPFGINRDLTRQAKEVYIFNTNEPRDREYIRNLLGSETEKMLDSLGQYEYVFWRDNQPPERGKA